MKRFLTIMILACLVLLCTACSENTIIGETAELLSNMINSNSDIVGMLVSDDASLANDTFSQMVDALQTGDEEMLTNLFSNKAIQNTETFHENVSELIALLNGDIQSFSQFYGVSTSLDSDAGKKVVDVQSSYAVETSSETFYFAILQCTADDNDVDNVGVHSIYVINSKEWQDSSVYRGSPSEDGWEAGVNIIDERPVEG